MLHVPPSCTLHALTYCPTNAYLHTPPAKPGVHEQLYELIGILALVWDEKHAAPFLHGLLTHSSTSTSHTPPSWTRHWAAYWLMNPYVHTPLAHPSLHAHENASKAIFLPFHDFLLESEQPAPFLHGDDTHSSMSISHCPPTATVQLGL
jgi:hypothetical protein